MPVLEVQCLHCIFKAMMVLKEAVSVSEDVMRDIQTLYSLQEVRLLVHYLALFMPPSIKGRWMDILVWVQIVLASVSL